MTSLARYWWIVALRGVIALLFGILILANPAIGLAVVIAFVGAYFLVDGVFALISAFQHREYRHWGFTLAEGIIGIIAGIITFFYPGLTAITLLYLIAAWAVVTGILEIIAAIRLREVIQGEFLLALIGVVSIVFGIFLFLQPGLGVLAVLGIIAGYAIVFGVLMIALSLRLRSWGHTSTTAPHAV